MRLRWSPEAADDLEGIVKYIAQDNPEAGREVALKIREGLMGLRTFPHTGRAGRLEGRSSWSLRTSLSTG
jgi:plasmid stabilization system protein ParE